MKQSVASKKLGYSLAVTLPLLAFLIYEAWRSIFYWEKLLRSIPADSELIPALNERIAEAMALAKVNDRK